MKKLKGFTLIELLIVIGIIGLLATLAIVSLTSAQRKARDTKRVADLKTIQTGIELYANEEAEYPAVTSATTKWSDLGTTLTTLSAMPVDPQNSKQQYSYGVVDVDTNGNPIEYMLSAQLEDFTQTAMDQSYKTADGGATGSEIPVVNSSGAAAAAGIIECSTDSATGLYCLHNKISD